MGNLIRKPSELEVSPVLSALIYGQPGVGKSTLACSAPNPILFDFDGGVGRIDASHQVDTVQVRSWEEALEALAEVERERPDCKTLVVDTAGKMLLFIEDYIRRVEAPGNSSLTMRDGSLSLKGYSRRKTIFTDFNNRLKMSGRNVIYVAHEREERRKLDKDEIVVKRPEIGSSSNVNDLMKELDLVGYMQAYDKRRMITFDPQETFYAKNSCNIFGLIELPFLFDAQGNATGSNDFMTRAIEGYRQRLENNRQQAVLYDQVCEEIRTNASSIECADDANNFVAWVRGVKHVFNSKVVAQSELSRRVAELGLKYDKSTKTYSDAPAA